MSEWTIKLLDCFHAPIAYLWSYCIPCGIACMQATTARLVVPEENASIKACLFAVFLCCFGTGLNRSDIRKNLSINGTYLEDCFLTWCLPCCAMVQEWREVMKAKGKDEDEVVWKAYSEYNTV